VYVMMMMVYVYVVCYASLVDALEIRYPLYIYIAIMDLVSVNK
jgi:hypothetical protein